MRPELVVAEALVARCRIELARVEARLAELKKLDQTDYSANWRDYSFKFADEDSRLD